MAAAVQITHWKGILLLIIICSGFGCASQTPKIPGTVSTPIKAIAFLEHEVPAWPRENRCFSCHNNGDAARALFAAKNAGYKIPGAALHETVRWLQKPGSWKNNKGDPGFSDPHLANLQFTLALAAALESGIATDRSALETAMSLLLEGQSQNGSWPIDEQNPVGSPATYGPALATALALTILENSGSPSAKSAAAKARPWLDSVPLINVPSAAAWLMTFGSNTATNHSRHSQAIALLASSQTSTGGWGPYSDSPPETFDTAIAILGLLKISASPPVDTMIRRGRHYLITTQLPDGSWPATTRPTGGFSYAQQLSTTGWALLALLASDQRISNRN